MDNKLIEQYGEDILCYRLRTARQKKRMQYKDFDKQLLRLHRERKELWEIRRNLGYEPLIPPIQVGWKRSFVLRDDVARSKQAEFFEGILNKINTRDWSHRKDFLVKKRRFRRRVYVVKTQQLQKIAPDAINRKGITPEEFRFFHEEYEYDHKGNRCKYYVFSDPWRFVLRVEPNMVDKVPKHDYVLESKLRKIRNYLDNKTYERRLDKLLSGHHQYWWDYDDRKLEVYPYKNKSLKQILDLIHE